MMVSSISEPSGTDANGESYWDSESAVTVIESVYNAHNDVFGVVKTRRTSDLVKWSEKDNKYVAREWEIWRLKTE